MPVAATPPSCRKLELASTLGNPTKRALPPPRPIPVRPGSSAGGAGGAGAAGAGVGRAGAGVGNSGAGVGFGAVRPAEGAAGGVQHDRPSSSSGDDKESRTITRAGNPAQFQQMLNTPRSAGLATTLSPRYAPNFGKTVDRFELKRVSPSGDPDDPKVDPAFELFFPFKHQRQSCYVLIFGRTWFSRR